MRYGRRRGGGAGIFLGLIALYYGIQALVAGAPLDYVLIQFGLAALMIGLGVFGMLRRRQHMGSDIGPDEPVPTMSVACLEGNHAFCTTPTCQCRCGHRGIY